MGCKHFWIDRRSDRSEKHAHNQDLCSPKHADIVISTRMDSTKTVELDLFKLLIAINFKTINCFKQLITFLAYLSESVWSKFCRSLKIDSPCNVKFVLISTIGRVYLSVELTPKDGLLANVFEIIESFLAISFQSLVIQAFEKLTMLLAFLSIQLLFCLSQKN